MLAAIVASYFSALVRLGSLFLPLFAPLKDNCLGSPPPSPYLWVCLCAEPSNQTSSSGRERELPALHQWQPKTTVILSKDGDCVTLGYRLNSNEPLWWEQGRLKHYSGETLQPDLCGVKAGGIFSCLWRVRRGEDT